MAAARRAEDLPELARCLLEESEADDGRSQRLSIDKATVALLSGRPWPGNVRELRNCLWRCRLKGAGRADIETVRRMFAEPESTTVFPRELFGAETLAALKRHLERDYLLHHVRRLRGDPGVLCDYLHHKRRQLYRLLQRAGVSLRESQRVEDGR